MNKTLLLTKAIFCCFLALFSFTAMHAQCNWEAVGPDDDQFFMEDSSMYYLPAIASDNNGVQYVAWCDGAHGSRVSVKRYVNDHWTFVGTPGFSTAKADFVKVATDNLNRVYVAYQDYANGKRVTVQYYNGFSWSVLGSAGMGNDTLRTMDFTVDKSNNHPLVYFTDSVDVSTVLEYNGTSWTNVGPTNFAQPQMYEGRITGHNGTPYLCYTSYGPGAQIHILQFNGTAWVPLGTPAAAFANSSWSSALTFDNNDVPHIAFQDYSAGGLPSVMYLNVNTWTYLGTAGFLSYATWYNELAFDASNNAYLAYTKVLGAAAEIAKYNGSSWSVVSSVYTPANAYITSQYAYYRGMSINPVNDHLFMLYTERTASPLMGWRDYGVREFDGTSCVMTGGRNAPGPVNLGSGAAGASFNFDRNGIPYVVYSDSLNSDRISVMKYVNNSWVQVGAPGFNGGVTEFPTITFDTSNVPYVAFRQGNSDGYVMKFNGTSWVYIGTPIPLIVEIDLAINPLTNQPHIFYADGNSSFLGNVKKFNGSSWVSEGPANFTVGSCGYENIRFDNLGNEYIGYSDNGLGTKAIVKQFNGSTWVTVGGGPISAGVARKTKLRIDAQNRLYVLYQDQANSYKPLVHQFNGSTWPLLGSYVSNAYVNDADLAIDNGGNVFVYYSEQYLNYYPGTVRRFFGSSWIPVGDQYISNTSCQTTQIQISPVSGLPTIGSITRPGVPTSTMSKRFFMKSLPCNFGAALMGNVVYDVNSDCINGAGEPGLNNQPVLLSQGPTTDLAFTDGAGQYYFTSAAPGSYTIGMGNLTNGYNVACAASLPHATSIVSTALTTENFSIACTPQFDMIANSFSPIGTWWPNQVVRLWSHVYIQQTACDGAPTPGTIRLVFPPCLRYHADTTLPWQPDSVSLSTSGDTMWYYVPDVYNPTPYLYNTLYTSAQVCSTATIGDSLCIELSVSAANDANLSNNVYHRCIHIAASYDPNFKEVAPAGLGSEGFIPATTGEMRYTVHFQNTGTAPAVNVRITDTISANLDPATFRIVASSHAMQGNSLVNGVMTFNFLNIMLPDSGADFLNSMGYVTYTIDLRPGLSPLTEIENTAYIYFDFNAPVVTNTTLNTIEVTSGVEERPLDGLLLYPNPATSEISLNASANFTGVTIRNMMGQVVYQQANLNTAQLNVNVQEFSSGVYFIEVNAGEEVRVLKFVKK